MTKLCTYIVKRDTGLAPNPYWGTCTLSVCTPNHQGARLDKGDWIAGFLTRDEGNRLLFVMQVDERLHMNDYFHDKRFEKKKPNLRGGWQERCGDNFYSLSQDGAWKQHRNRFHLGQEHLHKDTRKPFVFAGKKFWYFGREAKVLPKRFFPLVGGRGIRINHDPDLVANFLQWIDANEPGIYALPIHNPDILDSKQDNGNSQVGCN